MGRDGLSRSGPCAGAGRPLCQQQVSQLKQAGQAQVGRWLRSAGSHGGTHIKEGLAETSTTSWLSGYGILSDTPRPRQEFLSNPGGVGRIPGLGRDTNPHIWFFNLSEICFQAKQRRPNPHRACLLFASWATEIHVICRLFTCFLAQMIKMTTLNFIV